MSEQLIMTNNESKNYKYICKDITINANCAASVEVLAPIEGFLPKTLQMIVKNSETNQDAVVEIANINVMGDPQLVNFNGMRNSSMRGLSLVFSQSQDFVDFVTFGAYNGQGLVFDLINPNNYSVNVSIILSGLNVSNEMVGMR